MEIFGVNERALFANAGKALFEVMVTSEEPPSESGHQHRIEIEGEDWPDLMINWLRELLYFWHGAQQIINRIEIESLTPTRLQALVTSEDFSPQIHQINKEIKAVTYHQIDVGSQADGSWRARVVFDV